MKTFKVTPSGVIPFIVILGAMLLSACSGFNFALTAPTAAPATSAPAVSAPAAANPPAATTAAQSLPVAAVPGAQTQPQTQIQVAADVQALQDAYQAIFKAVNPSVVTITISAPVSSVPRLRGNGGQGGQGQESPPLKAPALSGIRTAISSPITTWSRALRSSPSPSRTAKPPMPSWSARIPTAIWP